MKVFVVDKWKIIRYACALAIIGFVFTLAGKLGGNIIATIANSTRKLPIYCIDTDSNNISLTFDCAWGESR